MQHQEETATPILTPEEEKSLRQKDFQLISATLHHVDFKTNIVVDATDKLNGNEISKFLSELIDTITKKGDKRAFKFPTSTSEIVAATNLLIRDASRHIKLAENISYRLLAKETKAQADREKKNLKYDLRKGSLIQALLKRYDKFEYLLLKIEHDSFFTLENLVKQYGLAEKKSVIKSCLIKYNDNYLIDSVFLTDTNSEISKYWWDNFLELEKFRKDSENTNIAFKEINKLLVRFVKPYDAKENRFLRESMIRYFKEKESLNFSLFKKDLFEDYKPENKEIKYGKFLDALEKLGNSDRFDTSFSIDFEAIKKDIKSMYRVTNKISLVIDGELPEDAISTVIESTGSKYLKIKIDDEDTFKQFEK